MDTLPGCTTRNGRDNITSWTFSGAIVSAVGVLWPIWLMVWNLIWQILGGIFFGMLSCVSGCNPCVCSISSGFACTSCCSSCLFPIGFLSEVSCGGSCAALGTAWVKILTFAGFTGAWYLFLGDLVFCCWATIIRGYIGNLGQLVHSRKINGRTFSKRRRKQITYGRRAYGFRGKHRRIKILKVPIYICILYFK